MICIENAKVVLENGILWDGVILIENDRIAAVGKRGEIPIPAQAQLVDAKGLYVGPGFVDIHNHGGNGFRFDTEPAEAARYFLQHGETTVLATLFYDLNKKQFLEAIRRIRAAMQTEAGANIGGCYMEGPYLNPRYGGNPDSNQWKGAIQAEDYEELVDCAGEMAKVWAVAPERDGIEDFVRYARSVNPDVTVAVAHSEATPEQINKLKQYGLALQTHCMNATGRVSPWRGVRGCGPDEACFMDKQMYAELICDSLGVHVNPQMQQLILQNKGVDQVVLITDSYVSDLQSPEDLRHVTDLCFDANRDLCGSRLTMDAACRNVMTHTSCGVAQTFLMASRNPARVIGIDNEVGTIAAGKKANLVFVDDAFHVQRVMFNGVMQS